MSYFFYLFILFAFLWSSQGKNTEVVCHCLFQWTTFCQTSPTRPISLGWPYIAWPSFIKLVKAVVHVIRLVSFYDCGFSLSALWCPLSAPTVLLGFLLHGVSSRLLQQSAAAAPYLGMGYFLTAAATDFGHRVSPLRCSPLQLCAAGVVSSGSAARQLCPHLIHKGMRVMDKIKSILRIILSSHKTPPVISSF